MMNPIYPLTALIGGTLLLVWRYLLHRDRLVPNRLDLGNNLLRPIPRARVVNRYVKTPPREIKRHLASQSFSATGDQRPFHAVTPYQVRTMTR